ncbi:MAG: hypothetical protein ACSLFH_00805 [Desulfuromonadales bacterium]
MNRKRVILAALSGVLVLCLIYAYVATPRLEKAPPRAVNQRVRPEPEPTVVLTELEVSERINFDFLTVDARDFPGAKRDIFHFVQRRPALPAAIVKPPVVVPVPVAPAVPFQVVQQSLSKFTFLGFLEKSGEKTVFLSSGGKLFLAKRGEDFGADLEFQVADIVGNILKVRHAGRDGLIEIPLIEQQKLNASVSAPARLPPLAGVSSQPGKRALTPRPAVVRPGAPQESEQPVSDTIEEDSPIPEQATEPPAEGDVLEGEINGTNQ